MLGRSWEAVEKVLRRSWEGIGKVLGSSWEDVGKELGRHWEGIGKVLGRCWESIGKELGRCWEGIGKVLGRHWEGVGEALGRSWEGVGKELGRCWEGIGKALGRCWEGVGKVLGRLCSAACVPWCSEHPRITAIGARRAVPQHQLPRRADGVGGKSAASTFLTPCRNGSVPRREEGAAASRPPCHRCDQPGPARSASGQGACGHPRAPDALGGCRGVAGRGAGAGCRGVAGDGCFPFAVPGTTRAQRESCPPPKMRSQLSCDHGSVTSLAGGASRHGPLSHVVTWKVLTQRHRPRDGPPRRPAPRAPSCTPK